MTYRRNPDADPIASALGQRTSAKKRASSRENGKLGGPLRQFDVFQAGFEYGQTTTENTPRAAFEHWKQWRKLVRADQT